VDLLNWLFATDAILDSRDYARAVRAGAAARPPPQDPTSVRYVVHSIIPDTLSYSLAYMEDAGVGAKTIVVAFRSRAVLDMFVEQLPDGVGVQFASALDSTELREQRMDAYAEGIRITEIDFDESQAAVMTELLEAYGPEQLGPNFPRTPNRQHLPRGTPETRSEIGGRLAANWHAPAEQAVERRAAREAAEGPSRGREQNNGPRRERTPSRSRRASSGSDRGREEKGKQAGKGKTGKGKGGQGGGWSRSK